MSIEDNNKFSKKIVISAIVAVVGYTIIHLIFSWHYRDIPVQLTVSWFTFWGVELGYLAGMRIKERIDMNRFDFNKGGDYR